MVTIAKKRARPALVDIVMSQRMSEPVSRTAGWRTRAGWATVLATVVSWLSACVSDADIPPCVRDHSCGQAGASARAGAAGAESFPQVGGAEAAGATASTGGTVDATAGEGGASEAGAGEGGAGEGGAAAGAPSLDAGAGGMDLKQGGECERCVILPAELVAPCAQQPYHATLHVTGGVAPYAWQLAPAVEGWSVTPDPNREGTAFLDASEVGGGDTELVIRAVDARGLDVRVEYRARARDACWFAYTASGAGGPKLALVDGLREPAEPAVLAHNTNVYDFQFSPDGRYLAYRYAAGAQFPHGQRLALVELSNLHETALAFGEDAISAYAWSPNGAVLAVGFTATGERFLGGVRMPVPGSGDAPTQLAPIAALVEDNLAWVGNGAVAWHAEALPDWDNPGQFLPNPLQQHTPLYARLGSTSFGSSQFAVDSFEPNLVLQPASDGFWVVIDSLTTFFPMTGNPPDSVLHIDVKLVAPSGRYSAGLDGETLQLFAAHDGVFSGAQASSKPAETCPMPLAWSQQDRIACVADIDNGVGLGTHGEVRFFDWKGTSDLLTLTTLQGFCEDDTAKGSSSSCAAMRQGYGYGIDQATRMPRAFSASGRWFAFARASGQSVYVYWADLDATPVALSGSLFLGLTGAPTRLAFSPDNRQLGLQAGTGLFIKALSGVSSEMLVTSELEVREKCTEEFPNAPNRYCGNTAVDAPFKWAPDSKALAYRSHDVITVVDTSHAADVVKFLLPIPVCEAPNCSGGFEFQPLIQP